jgi:hypothetical protein
MVWQQNSDHINGGEQPAKELRRSGSSPSSYQRLGEFQRSVGNQAVARMLGPDGPVVQRRKLNDTQLDEAKWKYLRWSVAGDVTYQKTFPAARTAAARLQQMLLGMKKGQKIEDYDQDDIQAIESLVAAHPPSTLPASFDAAVDFLDQNAVQKGYARVLKGLPLTPKPGVMIGPCPSVGFYDAQYHVIVLDPSKNPTPDELLDTLLFESYNAVRRPQYKAEMNKGGEATAKVEFKTDEAYVNALVGIYGATSLRDLVTRGFGIDAEHLGQADFATAKEEGGVRLPDKSKLGRQSHRQALWWWKTQDWDEQQRRQLWGEAPHAPGMAASTATYAKSH